MLARESATRRSRSPSPRKPHDRRTLIAYLALMPLLSARQEAIEDPDAQRSSPLVLTAISGSSDPPSATVAWTARVGGTVHAWVDSDITDLSMVAVDVRSEEALHESGAGGGAEARFLGFDVTPGMKIRLTVTSRAGPGEATLHRVHLYDTEEVAPAVASARERLGTLKQLIADRRFEPSCSLVIGVAEELSAISGTLHSLSIADLQLEIGEAAIRVADAAMKPELMHAAVGCHRSVLHFLLRTHPTSHVSVQDARLRLARTLRSIELLPEARELAEEAVAAYSHSLPADDLRLQKARLDLAITLGAMGKQAEARELAAAVQRAQVQAEPDLGRGRLHLAMAMRTLGDREEASRLLEQALAGLAESAPEDDDDLALARHVLGVAALDRGDFAEAQRLLERAHAVLAVALPEDHRRLLSVRANLGEACYYVGDLEAAESLQQEVLAGCLRSLHGDHPNVQRARNRLGLSFMKIGEHEAARDLFQDALEVRERTLPEDHSDLNATRGNLAIALRQLGDLAAARSILVNVLEAEERSLPKGHFSVQVSRVNLANLLSDLGDLRGARDLSEKALGVLSRQLAPDDPRLQVVRSGLASILYDLEEYEQARNLFERVLTVNQERLRQNHPDLLWAKSNVAITMRSLGEPEAAMPLQREVLQSWSEELPSDHETVLSARVNLALTLQELGRPEEARALLETVLQVRSKSLPPDHPAVQKTRAILATMLADIGDNDRLGTVLLDLALGMRGTARFIEALLDPRSASAAAVSPDFDRHVSTLLWLIPRLDKDTAARLTRETFAVVNALRDAEQKLLRLQKLLAVRGDEESKVNELRSALREVARDVSTFSRNGDSEKLSDAIAHRDRLHDQVLNAVAPTENAGRSLARSATATDVAAALTPGVAAVGLWQYFRRGEGAYHLSEVERWYVAFVVLNTGSTTAVELGSAESIDACVADWVDGLGVTSGRGFVLGTKGSKLSTDAGEALRRLLLDPILSAVGDVDRLIVTPVGVLNSVPLDALPLGDSFVGNKLEIVVVPTMNDVAWPDTRRSPEPSLLALGGVDFAGPNHDREVATPERPRGVPPGVLREGSGTFSALPGSASEVVEIASIFRQHFGENRWSAVLQGSSASSFAFEKLASEAAYVHLATHGWYAAEPAAVDAIDGRGHQQTDPDGSAPTAREVAHGHSPHVLCGLALAGANRRNDDGSAPGIITAEEIMALDLGTCELCVLSACETGIGLSSGIKMSSLRDALHVAGVRRTLTSLWTVDDRATRRLMVEFYRRVWIDRLPIQQALWDAKMVLRGDGEPTAHWAGWILSGPPDGASTDDG